MSDETPDSARCTVCGELPCDNPHPRFTVILKIDAHSWDEASEYIQEFAAELEQWFQGRKKPANRCTCGDTFVAVTGAHDAACPVVRISDRTEAQK